MKRLPLYHCRRAFTGVLAACLAVSFLASFLTPGTAFAASRKTDTVNTTDVHRSGSLPKPGRIVIRSGLAWMNETSPAFQTMARGLEQELTSLGFTVVPYDNPSKTDPMPETPLQRSAKNAETTEGKTAPPKGPAVSGGEAKEKTGTLAKDGKLPKLKLRSYDTPQRDADLPQTVKDIRPPDVSGALYAKSQELGRPVVHNFAVPGRVPAEVESDAAYADYTLVVRFASVRSWGAVPDRFMGVPGTLVAAATIKGTGALGYGPPASPSASSPPSTYGTPGGFVRGYEGNAPSDFWGRDRDYLQRDYMFKHGEKPQYATPPKDFTPGMHMGTGTAPEYAGRHTLNIDEWLLIFMECYDLAPVHNGQKPAVVWSISARKPVQGEPFAKGVTSLAKAVFAVGGPARSQTK
ncbi:MAG: hypothetical protein DELT_00852 [Desulfovibrio sp.]